MNRIRQLRENADLRQIAVSNATGIDQKTLSNYETGKTNPDSYALIKLADFFDVSIDYLINRVDSTVALSDKEYICQKIDAIKQELNDIKKYL